MTLPPPPPLRPAGMDAAFHALSALGPDRELEWRPVTVRGVNGPWVGIATPVTNPGRPWLWDVLTPDTPVTGTVDEFTLFADQDVVVVKVEHPGFGDVVTLRVPVRHVPERIEIPASVIPPEPWVLSVQTGWTAERIGDTLREWAAEHLGIRFPAPEHDQGGDDRYDLDGVFIDDRAMDRLLMIGPGEAAMVCASLRAVSDSLSSWC